jgi:hypothetical protein
VSGGLGLLAPRGYARRTAGQPRGACTPGRTQLRRVCGAGQGRTQAVPRVSRSQHPPVAQHAPGLGVPAPSAPMSRRDFRAWAISCLARRSWAAALTLSGHANGSSPTYRMTIKSSAAVSRSTDDGQSSVGSRKGCPTVRRRRSGAVPRRRRGGRGEGICRARPAAASQRRRRGGPRAAPEVTPPPVSYTPRARIAAACCRRQVAAPGSMGRHDLAGC